MTEPLISRTEAAAKIRALKQDGGGNPAAFRNSGLEEAARAVETGINTPAPVSEEITQADRDAAAPWVIAPQNARKIRNGEMDWNPLVQAFARHRLSSLTAPQPAQSDSGEVERLLLKAQHHLHEGLTTALPSDDQGWMVRERFQKAKLAVDAALSASPAPRTDGGENG